jgi:hypothetical protein
VTVRHSLTVTGCSTDSLTLFVETVVPQGMPQR